MPIGIWGERLKTFVNRIKIKKKNTKENQR